MVELPENSFQPANRQEWREWLRKNHQKSTGVWVIFFKKASSKVNLVYSEMVEEALCFGWIDSHPRKLDAERSSLWFTPRKKGSKWSALNKKRVQKLLEHNLLEAAGKASIERAKKDGTWSALDSVEALEVPEDLKAALEALPPAATHFSQFPRSVKKAILEWILNAKRPETRSKRVIETAQLAQRNERANQWRK